MKPKSRILITIILIILTLSFATISYGFGIEDLTGNQVQADTVKNVGNTVVKVISTVGVIVSVVVLVVLGIKYMMGSTEEKASYKKSLLPYAIGAFLVFVASEIAQLIYNLAIEL